MNKNTRACVAYVVGKAISGSGGTHIYDYSQSRHVTIGGSVSDGSVSVYDYERSCHFSGSLAQPYDYGTGAHVSIQINDTSFSGYDFGAGHHFSGSVSGSSVALYDYGESKHFNYSL